MFWKAVTCMTITAITLKWNSLWSAIAGSSLASNNTGLLRCKNNIFKEIIIFFLSLVFVWATGVTSRTRLEIKIVSDWPFYIIQYDFIHYCCFKGHCDEIATREVQSSPNRKCEINIVFLGLLNHRFDQTKIVLL